MATYSELYTLAFANNGTVLQRVAVACMVQAEVVRAESDATVNHASRILWARDVFENPEAMAVKMWRAMLAQNASLTVTQINNATDAALLTAVANAVNVFATGA